MKGKGNQVSALKSCKYSYKKETEQQLELFSAHHVAAAVTAFCPYNGFQ